MRKFCFVLLALVPVSAVCQVTIQKVHTECPVEATRIIPRVYAFRIYTAGVEGWRPDSKMALDLWFKITGDRGVAAMSFEIAALNDLNTSWGAIVLRRFDNVPVNAKPGDRRAFDFPANQAPLMDIYPGVGFATVIVTELRYDDGEIVDFNTCTLGYAPIPPPFKPEKPASPSPIYLIGGDVTSPRVLEQHVMDEQNNWRGPPASILLSCVIEVDGSPQDIKVISSTFSAELNQKAIETLRTWNFAPAMMGDKPVATRTTVQLKFGR